MKKISLAVMGISMLANAAFALNAVQGKAQLVVAIQNEAGTGFGTDAGTTSYPNAGMNNMPTKDVGTQTDTVNQNAPFAKPGEVPDLTAPPLPAYVAPSSQNPPPLSTP